MHESDRATFVREAIQLQLELDTKRRLWMQAFEEANRDKTAKLASLRELIYIAGGI